MVLANPAAQKAADDDSSTASPDATSQAKSQRASPSATQLSHRKGGVLATFPHSLNYDAAPTSALVPAAGMVLDGPARKPARLGAANVATAGSASSEAELGHARTDEAFAVIGLGSRAGFARRRPVASGVWRSTIRALSPEETPGLAMASWFPTSCCWTGRPWKRPSIDSSTSSIVSPPSLPTLMVVEHSHRGERSGSRAALASGMIIQRRRSQGERANGAGPDREEELTHFPGLSNSWNWGFAGT